MKSFFALLAVTAASVMAQTPTVTFLKKIASPCATINTQDVAALDANYLYLGCDNGNIRIFDQRLTAVQTVTDLRNPVSSVVSSTEQQESVLYATTVNGPSFNGNYIERFNKTNRAVTGVVIPNFVSDQKRLATEKDANLWCSKVFGFDLVVSAIGYNYEANPHVSCAADNVNIYVSSGAQPARVLRGDQAFSFPEESQFKANSTVVYDHSGNLKAVLSSDQIGGCSPNLFSNGKVLIRTCSTNLLSGSLKGKGILINSLDDMSDGGANFFSLPWASAASVITVSGSDYVVVGTLAGDIQLLKLVGTSVSAASISFSLFQVFGGTTFEPYFDENRKSAFNTDLMVQSIVARENVFLVLTRPRWSQIVQSGFFSNPPAAAAPTLSVFTIK